jgi:hypothetical protein
MEKNKKVLKKLESTKKVISTKWQKYKIAKDKIQNRRIGSFRKQGLINSLLKNTRKDISKSWDNYSGYKQAIKTGYGVKGLVYKKTLKQQTVKSLLFEVKDINNIEGMMLTLFEKFKAKYVLVTVKILRPFPNEDLTENTIDERGKVIENRVKFNAGIPAFYADSFSFEGFKQVLNNGEKILDKVIEKISFNQFYNGYILKAIYLRAVIQKNEKPKKNKVKNKTRKAKR